MIIFKEREPTVPEAMQVFGLTSLKMSLDDLRSLYRKLSIKQHPDKGGSVEKMQDVNAAYEVLKKNLGRSTTASSSHDARPAEPRSSSSHNPVFNGRPKNMRDLAKRYPSYFKIDPRDGALDAYPLSTDVGAYFTMTVSAYNARERYEFDRFIYEGRSTALSVGRELNDTAFNASQLLALVTHLSLSSQGESEHELLADVRRAIKFLLSDVHKTEQFNKIDRLHTPRGREKNT